VFQQPYPFLPYLFGASDQGCVVGEPSLHPTYAQLFRLSYSRSFFLLLLRLEIPQSSHLIAVQEEKTLDQHSLPLTGIETPRLDLPHFALINNTYP
jgi:hypothetical protein